MRTTSSTEKSQRVPSRFDQLRVQPFRPARDLTQAEIDSLKVRTPLEELTTKWHDERQKSDQGGDS